jgi:hypothetical protein
MAKPSKTIVAFATWHPKKGINEHWIRPRAKDIREANIGRWEAIKKMGWRIVRVKVTVDHQ